MTKAVQMSLYSNIESCCQAGWFSSALTALNVAEGGRWPDRFGDALRYWNINKLQRKITVISLFSGGGGLDIGFHDAGFQLIECNEIEPAFAATLRINSSEGKHLEGAKIVCKNIDQYSPSVKQVDFIIGGPPCQTFSAAGARAAGVNGTDDDRGNLFLQYARILEILKPKGFLFENVYRIVGAQSGKPWGEIQETFRAIGYKLYWRILDAADYGVPQFRERLIIIGLKEGNFLFPFPSHGPDSPDCHKYYTSGEAVSGIDTSQCKTGIGGRHGYLLNEIPPGLNYSFYTEKMGHPKPIFAWRSKFSDYLYKADPNAPVRTIKAQGGQYTGPFSWENRPFTNEELKRLQTFPDDYFIQGSKQTVIHQLGNSVPPQLARILALSILNQVFGISLPFEFFLMPEDYKLGFRKRKRELTSLYSKKATYALLSTPSHDIKCSIKINGTEFFSLTHDLQIKLGLSKNDSNYTAYFSLSDSEWVIELTETKANLSLKQYEIEITHPLEKGIEDGSAIVTKLISRSTEIKSLLALWKIYEVFIQRHLFKDDLVQLFGYYQYKKTYSMAMTLINDSLLMTPFWGVLQKVISGQGVGAINQLSELNHLYNLESSEALLSCLRVMKNIGYEIRNHKTNKQIRDGMILIPYPFPTLNERSLQRLTRL